MNNVSLSQSVISICTQNYKRIRRTCQDFFKQDIIPLPSKPIHYLEQQDPLTIKLLDILARFENYYFSKGVFPTQITLAKELGISRQHCNELLGQLVVAGIIMSNYRHKKSCQYKFSSYFNLMEVRTSLRHLIPSFKWINIAVLTTTLLHQETFPNSVTTQIRSPFVFIKTIPPRILNVGGLYTSKVVNFEAMRFSHRKKRKFVMKNPIMPEIRHIPGVNFTMQNQIGLSLFPAEAIRFAMKEFIQCKDIRNPFGWIRTVCNKYCQEKGIQPNYQWVTALETAYKSNPKQFLIQDESPYTSEDLKPLTKISQTKSNASQKFPKKGNDHFSPTYKIPHQSEEDIVGSFKEKKKAWIQTLPPASDKVMRQMAKFFPGTQEELELIIKQNSLEREAWVKQNQGAKMKEPEEKASPPKTLDEIDFEYAPNYNDVELYEEIIEEPIW